MFTLKCSRGNGRDLIIIQINGGGCCGCRRGDKRIDRDGGNVVRCQINCKTRCCRRVIKCSGWDGGDLIATETDGNECRQWTGESVGRNRQYFVVSQTYRHIFGLGIAEHGRRNRSDVVVKEAEVNNCRRRVVEHGRENDGDLVGLQFDGNGRRHGEDKRVCVDVGYLIGA